MENDCHESIESDGEIRMDSSLYHDSSSGNEPDSSFSSGPSESSVSGSDQSDFEVSSEEDEVVQRAAVGDCGDMFEPCQHCGALKLKPFRVPCKSPGEVRLHAVCCKKGRAYLDEQTPSPSAEYFHDLWSSNHAEGRVFRKYARKINNAFSLASFVATEAEVGGFNPSFKVRGKAYVTIGSLLPGLIDVPKFSQIYVYDAEDDEHRLDIHMSHMRLGNDVPIFEREILAKLFKDIEKNIRICNPYVQQFIMAKDKEVPPEKTLIFHPEVPTGSHIRTYNAPSHELMVWATDDLQLTYPPLVLERNMMYCDHNPNIPKLEMIHDCHPMYDLIRYLFFFPDGGGET